MEQVPCYLDEDVQIGQSIAIIEYLAAKNPDKGILPSDPVVAAKVREVSEMINSGIQPLQNLAVLQDLKKDFAMTDEQKVTRVKRAIEKGFRAIEKKLKMNSQFCFDQFTMADALLIPQVYNANRFEVDMDRFPKISSINEHCLSLDYFQKAAPENQPDTPKG